MKTNELVNDFCTPPSKEKTEFDKKAFASAQKTEIDFEGSKLITYSMGSGKKILLVHGWGSRASHLSLMARSLVKKGFHVIAFDLPAHGDSGRRPKDTSNLFEFGRAISCVAKHFGPIYTVIGHSFGGMSAAFTISGTGRLCESQFDAEKLVLISSPQGMPRVIEHYCKNKNMPELQTELTSNLKSQYNFKVTDYDLCKEMNRFNAQTLIIHDELDEEIPASDAVNINAANHSSSLLLTNGAGHNKILMSREMLRAVGDFV